MGGGVAAAEMVRVEVSVFDPGEMVVGLNEQVMPAGATQLS
jgi:hypothetical protein